MKNFNEIEIKVGQAVPPVVNAHAKRSVRLLLLLAALSIPLHAQTPDQEPVDSHAIIRSDTRLVLVDTVVTDKKGAYVHDLTQKDFEVYEDNKKQNVTTFSVESGAAGENARKHYLVLFFDNSTAGPAEQTYARQAATKFIEKNAGPNRLMAIAEFGGSLRMAQNFTDDADRLKQVVAGVKLSSVGSASGGGFGGGGFGGRSGRAFGDYSIRGVLGALRNMAKGLADVPGRKTLVFLSGGFPMTQEILTEVTATIDACNRSNVAIYPIDIRGLVAAPAGGGFRPIGSLTNFQSLAELAMLHASTLVGPLALQAKGGTGSTGGTTSGGGASSGGGTTGRSPAGGGISSGGGSAPVSRPTTGATGSTAGRGATTTTNNGGGGTANTVNNPMNRANGLRNVMPAIDSSITGMQQVLYALANGTGGFVIVNTNDLLGGMERIGKEQDEYYILGYTPSKEAEPGACHSLRVKADKASTIRARTGYCETKSQDVLSGTPAERDLEARIASNATPTVAGASMLAPFFYIAPNTARVDVSLEIPAGTIQFVKDKGKMRSNMNVVGIAYLPDGTVAARFSDSVKLTFEDKKEVEAFDANPFHYEKQFEMAPGTYNFKLVFSSSASQLGRLETPILIEPWEPTKFSLSGLALSHSVHPAKEMAGGLDAELLENRVPLIVSGVQITPTGSIIFKKAQKGYIYAEVYEPAMAVPDVKDKDIPAVGIRMELLDAQGAVKKDYGLTRLVVPPVTGNPTIPTGLVINAQDVEPGAYKLRVTAVDATGHESVRITDLVLM
jgi:VWFA-related protein